MDIESIVKRCQAGDKEAFGSIYRRYLMPMHEVVAQYVHNEDAIWDILHDGFIIAFQSIDSLKNTSKVKSWLTSIMKNLALQYIKDESSHKSVPLSDVYIANGLDDNNQIAAPTWDELDKIIEKLPNGCGNVFRLAVLDGLSHKEIGSLLGIAPHSSSSQLARAKAILRRMITKYHTETDILSLIGITLLLWQGIFKHRDEKPSTSIISKITDDKTPILSDSITNVDSLLIIQKRIVNGEREHIAEMTTPYDSISPTLEKDNSGNDTINIIRYGIDSKEHITDYNQRKIKFYKKTDWSISLAYAGNAGEHELNRYRIPNPNLTDGEYPTEEIEVTEKTHHYMPMVIGITINKTINSRWGIESGLRYTFLRSDFLSESQLESKETIQRIHYLGVPLKFNYRIFTYKGFTLYGQGGGAVDIPVKGSQNIWEYSEKSGKQNNRNLKIDTPLQWSVEGGLGVQYYFTKSISIYAEPSVRYYFNSESDIKTIRQEKPIEFYVPIGLRVSW